MIVTSCSIVQKNRSQELPAENNKTPFNVNVWTDKDSFIIGESIIFYFKANRDCYVILLDRGTSGNMRVIFPNPFQKDNFIQAGKIYTVPDPAAGYEINVNGPQGIERVKAIAFLTNLQLPLELLDSFYEVSPEDDVRVRDIARSVEKMDAQQWAQSSLEINIIDPKDPETGLPRKLKPKRPERPLDIIGTPGAIQDESPGAIEPKEPEKPVDILGSPGAKPAEKP
ncbi:MAG: hypothetical protein A3K09_04265 [Nitrospinae bacterium RIFCSPLOWO2_12_FULL_47_7]|nr:MAG: hypothetical protein A3K09_04265 [Nitrospinae bacterium RIFCSPLOWO2_12_FULL_47_7]